MISHATRFIIPCQLLIYLYFFYFRYQFNTTLMALIEINIVIILHYKFNGRLLHTPTPTPAVLKYTRLILIWLPHWPPLGFILNMSLEVEPFTLLSSWANHCSAKWSILAKVISQVVVGEGWRTRPVGRPRNVRDANSMHQCHVGTMVLVVECALLLEVLPMLMLMASTIQ